MITVKNAESYLKNKIGKDTDDMKTVWETFKAFCKEPVEREEDKEILFQCGVYDFTGEELFHLDFVRQFTIYEEDEYSRMEQLHCEFLFKPTDELRRLEIGEWSMDYDDIDDFFNEIENLKEFKIPLSLEPIKIEIYQEEI
ncbi:hypothetical protein [Heyndrickxia oleronia]|uniref:Uncharacterized protein n=1 Tax=Heyndrickxia oleronia TaxID=38875 RepID=A0A8E2I7G1_9BACI|nr:hypothetical protein [Heyndrickxia oleronia]MBU5212871.1 hypothetical protein [Heyndrickxia oleronia]MCI1590496.1 hypothetical protein [Heyndrickxia oleronia]MCI1612533.1 hypothetical protein [Heyndrickxia oleronia]MCI1743760.1 hypothetical protein [Heyndrickxia oleronia]MCI1760470.1 hypothetical protein [Heyndrickxia oleronia]